MKPNDSHAIQREPNHLLTNSRTNQRRDSVRHYAIGSRIPSVREYAALVEVNANTVMRSYEFLQTQGIIFNKRGIGFFVSPDAKIKIKSYRRNEFLKNELQRFFIQIYTLNISMEEIDLMYKQFIDKLNSKTSNTQL